jgi:hypothetical protein
MGTLKRAFSIVAIAALVLHVMPLAAEPRALASSGAPMITTRVEVEESGAFTETQVQSGPVAFTFNHSTGELSLPPNIQWVIPDDGLLYIPTSVAVGGRGSTAFYGCYLNNERTSLFSTTTTSEADAPIWSDTGLQDAWTDIYVDAADDGNVLVAVGQYVIGGDPSTREVRVYKYTSNSATPDWTYIFPRLINAGALVKVSKDGAYIAAALYDNAAGNIEIAYFASDSGTPLFTDSFAGSYIRALDMTDDGGLLYINEGTWVRIYDVASQSVIYSVDAQASFDSHTISGDGNRFAFGGFNFVKWYQWNGTTYEYQSTYNMPGSWYCARCDLSGDASTLAAAFYNYSPGLAFRVVSIDMATGGVNFEADFTGTGTLQNAPWAIKINYDGSRIAYGGWGDQGNTNPEVMVFEGSATPVASVDTRGSVFDVDISSDGAFVASGSKSVHANISGNGGDHACISMGGQALSLEGVPSLSNALVFTAEGNPGERVVLAASLNEVNIVLPFGTLMVDPSNYIELGRGLIGPGGTVEFDATVPGAPWLLGRKAVVQALFTGGGPRLSNGIVFWVLP